MSEPGTRAPAPRVPLDGDAVRAAVTKRAPWRDVVVVTETSSTNDDVARHARAGAAEGLVVVAEYQAAGRGRLGREWVSPPCAGITMSVLLRPTRPAERWPWVPLLAGLATARAVTDVAGIDARVKWPNDVLVSGRKLAGLLAEVAGGAVVVGLGVNVSTTRAELPRADTTSVDEECGGEGIDRATLLVAVLRRLGDAYLEWQTADEDAGALRGSYVARCDTVGRSVVVAVPGGRRVAGTAVDVDEQGRLVVQTPGGPFSVSAGDVEHVRAST